MLNDPIEEDPRVLGVARAYLADLEAGRQLDRGTYLARYPELREALEECLAGIDLAQSLRPPPAVAEPVARQLGDFQILREIGRGGMGVVYEAVQLSLGRRVALKLLPFAAGLDARRLQRFRTEAHAAAQLHHTNIVPVYSIGCERGVHFYAMQLIEGQSLASLIGQMRTEKGSAGRTGGSTQGPPGEATRPGSLTHEPQHQRHRTAARIALQVAEALEYAHSAGVIHRDIKPANLLLDGRGAVWITDFGLAQVLTEDIGPTLTGDLVGTLRYMSPEQAAGRRSLIDHRTDIYSLGATLYELLTLTPVFPGSDRPTLLRQILNEEPRSPRAVDRTLPVELETIVLKALAKSPGERYATAGSLAADLRCFLEDRPIQARRPTRLDRARKWLRRHPNVPRFALVLLVLGSAALAVTTALVSQEQQRTQLAYQMERERAQEAEARFRQARRMADELIAVAEEELADDPAREGLRKRLLETALGYYQEFVVSRSQEPDSPELAATRDRVRQILADLAVLQGDRQTYLLHERGVLDELRLDAEQRVRVQTFLQGLNDRRERAFLEGGRFFPPNRVLTEERRQQLLEAARSNEAALATLLQPGQLQRLKQLSLQAQGLRAFQDSEVARELRLTPEQKQRLRALQSEGTGPPPDRGPPLDRGPHPMSWPGRFDRSRPGVERMLALLTDEQQKKWKQLTGEPFNGSLPLGPRPTKPLR